MSARRQKFAVVVRTDGGEGEEDTSEDLKIIDTIVRQKTTVEFGVRDTKARIRRGAQ